jgi:hypothetical protein
MGYGGQLAISAVVSIFYSTVITSEKEIKILTYNALGLPMLFLAILIHCHPEVVSQELSPIMPTESEH